MSQTGGIYLVSIWTSLSSRKSNFVKKTQSYGSTTRRSLQRGSETRKSYRNEAAHSFSRLLQLDKLLEEKKFLERDLYAKVRVSG